MAYRVRKPTNSKRIIELASKGYIQEEIAAMEDCSVDTLMRHHADAYKKGVKLCDASLRRKQVQVALSGNPTMLIWLGKNRLDQKDKSETTHEWTGMTYGDLPIPVSTNPKSVN